MSQKRDMGHPARVPPARPRLTHPPPTHPDEAGMNGAQTAQPLRRMGFCMGTTWTVTSRTSERKRLRTEP